MYDGIIVNLHSQPYRAVFALSCIILMFPYVTIVYYYVTLASYCVIIAYYCVILAKARIHVKPQSILLDKALNSVLTPGSSPSRG